MATKKAAKSVSKVSASTVDGFTSQLKERAFVGSILGEVVGTFLVATAFIVGQGQPIIMFFALISVVIMVGNKAGSHLNPAVTLAAWATKKINGFRASMYVVAQLAGAALAYFVLNYFVQATSAASSSLYGGAHLYQLAAIPASKEMYVALAELIGALIIGYGYATAIKVKANKVESGLVQAAAVFMGLLFAGTAASYVSGSVALNPAFAMVLGVDYHKGWTYVIYLLAPVLGAVLGFVLHKSMSAGNKD